MSEMNVRKLFSEFQKELKGALKDSKNPHFKSSYADLESVWDACREGLTTRGFSVTQTPHRTESEWILRTTLMHESLAEDFLTGYFPIVPTKGDMQGFMAAVTYARRGSLASLLGIVQTDDDGETAVGRPPTISDVYKKLEKDFASQKNVEVKTLPLPRFIKNPDEVLTLKNEKEFQQLFFESEFNFALQHITIEQINKFIVEKNVTPNMIAKNKQRFLTAVKNSIENPS